MNEKLLAIQNNKELILSKSLNKFFEISNLKIQLGFEIEFYVRSSAGGDELLTDDTINSFFKLANDRCNEVEIFDKIELEKGRFQCEIKTKPSFDVDFALDKLSEIAKEIELCCKEINLIAIYDSRPFLEDCGNAFQINFSLTDNNGLNIFSNSSKIAADIADFITFHLSEIFVFSNKADEDFTRYDSIYNKSIFKSGKFVAPTSKSWGYDNRTCAVRVLNSASHKNNARIELRIPSNNSDKHLLISCLALLLCEFFSLEGDYKVKNKNIYGNSFDDNYVQHKFPESYQEAVECFFDEEGVIFPAMTKLL